MSDDKVTDGVRQTHERDQYFAARREDATALARDVLTYRDTLKGGGIDGDLLERMTEHFGVAWLRDETSQASISVMYAEVDDE